MGEWREEVMILGAEWDRLPLSFGAEEALWAKRGVEVDVSKLGGPQAEGLVAYAAKHADMYRNLARRAEIIRTRPKLARGHRAEREINHVYVDVDEAEEGRRADGLVEDDDMDEQGNDSDEENEE
ncbi:hypothetical protein MIND_00652900 [Mycena indigotica]|uniref:Uncharacterized protein n=1 Tax=Mycena indigotica TaxID=2126181 RepID=A0A8H6SSQ6_9AGAR|nr:uncharacterized protein MIND_00652900 [Mycena indigotica]KAF7304207.1 hypothetical protein MIND_00652900 [Mycena indigotica]